MSTYILLFLLLIGIIIFRYIHTSIGDFRNYSMPISYSKHFNDYINSVDSSMYKIKLGLHDLKNKTFKYHYLDSLDTPLTKYQNILNTYTNRCDSFLSDYPIFKKYSWKFLISKNDLELGMPFTIDDTIIIPEDIINNVYINYIRNPVLSNVFLNTLIHEQIHIVQRYNQAKFNAHYIVEYPFIKRIHRKRLMPHYSRIHMNNPDSNNQLWIYRIKNKNYVTFLKYDNGSLISVGGGLDKNEIISLDSLRTRYGFKRDTSLYHPNEIFACELSHKIVDRVDKGSNIDFLKSLK